MRNGGQFAESCAASSQWLDPSPQSCLFPGTSLLRGDLSGDFTPPCLPAKTGLELVNLQHGRDALHLLASFRLKWTRAWYKCKACESRSEHGVAKDCDPAGFSLPACQPHLFRLAFTSKQRPGSVKMAPHISLISRVLGHSLMAATEQDGFPLSPFLRVG